MKLAWHIPLWCGLALAMANASALQVKGYLDSVELDESTIVVNDQTFVFGPDTHWLGQGGKGLAGVKAVPLGARLRVEGEVVAGRRHAKVIQMIKPAKVAIGQSPAADK